MMYSPGVQQRARMWLVEEQVRNVIRLKSEINKRPIFFLPWCTLSFSFPTSRHKDPALHLRTGFLHSPFIRALAGVLNDLEGSCRSVARDGPSVPMICGCVISPRRSRVSPLEDFTLVFLFLQSCFPFLFAFPGVTRPSCRTGFPAIYYFATENVIVQIQNANTFQWWIWPNIG